jgi:hypothetical protein
MNANFSSQFPFPKIVVQMYTVLTPALHKAIKKEPFYCLIFYTKLYVLKIPNDTHINLMLSVVNLEKTHRFMGELANK